jgi:hypothetical protein
MQLILEQEEMEDLIQDWLLEQPEPLEGPEWGLLEKLYHLYHQRQVTLPEAMWFLELFLTSPAEEFPLPPELYPLAQKLQLLEMEPDEVVQ